MSRTVVAPEVSHYAYRVVWSAEDQEFVATCAEYPSLSWLDADQIEALRGLESLVSDVVGDLIEQGEDVPTPLAERPFSGNLSLRLGAELHRKVAVRAAEAGVSINRYVVGKVA